MSQPSVTSSLTALLALVGEGGVNITLTDDPHERRHPAGKPWRIEIPTYDRLPDGTRNIRNDEDEWVTASAPSFAELITNAIEAIEPQEEKDMAIDETAPQPIDPSDSSEIGVVPDPGVIRLIPSSSTAHMRGTIFVPKGWNVVVDAESSPDVEPPRRRGGERGIDAGTISVPPPPGFRLPTEAEMERLNEGREKIIGGLQLVNAGVIDATTLCDNIVSGVPPESIERSPKPVGYRVQVGDLTYEENREIQADSYDSDGQWLRFHRGDRIVYEVKVSRVMEIQARFDGDDVPLAS